MIKLGSRVGYLRHSPAIWDKMVLCRAFELEVAAAHKAGRLDCGPIYLSIGQEAVPATLTTLFPDFKVFASHRCHSWYLSLGGDPAALRDELCGRVSGCARGMGGSASIHIKDIMFGHDGLLGSNIPIAVGYALATNYPTICVSGDAGYEEDYALAALGFAVSKKAPVLFVVEDNGLSILTKTEIRRSWSIVKVAKGFGLNAIECTDFPAILECYVRNLLGWPQEASDCQITLPALINVSVSRHYWHAGSGQDRQPKTDTYVEYRNWLKNRHNSDPAILKSEAAITEEMSRLWQK